MSLRLLLAFVVVAVVTAALTEDVIKLHNDKLQKVKELYKTNTKALAEKLLAEPSVKKHPTVLKLLTALKTGNFKPTLADLKKVGPSWTKMTTDGDKKAFVTTNVQPTLKGAKDALTKMPAIPAKDILAACNKAKGGDKAAADLCMTWRNYNQDLERITKGSITVDQTSRAHLVELLQELKQKVPQKGFIETTARVMTRRVAHLRRMLSGTHTVQASSAGTSAQEEAKLSMDEIKGFFAEIKNCLKDIAAPKNYIRKLGVNGGAHAVAGISTEVSVAYDAMKEQFGLLFSASAGIELGVGVGVGGELSKSWRFGAALRNPESIFANDRSGVEHAFGIGATTPGIELDITGWVHFETAGRLPKWSDLKCDGVIGVGVSIGGGLGFHSPVNVKYEQGIWKKGIVLLDCSGWIIPSLLNPTWVFCLSGMLMGGPEMFVDVLAATASLLN